VIIEQKKAVDREQQRQVAADRALRQRLIRSNYGRNCGWFVEGRGQRLATLTEPQWAEMFWTSYLITPLTEDPTALARLATPEFWWGEDVPFRNREFDFMAPFALGAGAGPAAGRIAMRGLYFNVGLTWLDPAWLFYERFFPKKTCCPTSRG